MKTPHQKLLDAIETVAIETEGAWNVAVITEQVLEHIRGPEPPCHIFDSIVQRLADLSEEIACESKSWTKALEALEDECKALSRRVKVGDE